MKRTLLLTTFAVVASGSAFAQGFTETEEVVGFTGPVAGITTVDQVFDAGLFSDDMPVTLTGNIQSSLGDDMYVFSDDTGNVTVEIDDEDWNGLSVNPNTNVVLVGEIDKGLFGTTVDVDEIQIVPVAPAVKPAK